MTIDHNSRHCISQNKLIIIINYCNNKIFNKNLNINRHILIIRQKKNNNNNKTNNTNNNTNPTNSDNAHSQPHPHKDNNET